MSGRVNGTFFEFKHHNIHEGKYWNPALENFTAENWRQKVREISELGMEYIVVMATALYSTTKAFMVGISLMKPV